MIPVRINFPGQSSNAVAATQSITATAGGFVVLNGGLAPFGNVAPSASTASGCGANNQPVTLAGIARSISVFATSSATGVIFTVIGLDLLGNIVTATIIGASGGSSTASDAIATTSGFADMHAVLGVKASASMGNFTIGTGATGVTNWVVTDLYKMPFAMTVGASKLTATTTTYSIQDTPDNVQTATAPSIFTNPTISSIATTAMLINYSTIVTAVRGIVSGNAATGGVNFYFAQAGG